MKRFVDMREAEIEGKRFAWWDTVTGGFLEGEDQAWWTWEECKTDLQERWPAMDLGRLERLLPEWARQASEEEITEGKKKDFHITEIRVRRSESREHGGVAGDVYPLARVEER